MGRRENGSAAYSLSVAVLLGWATLVCLFSGCGNGSGRLALVSPGAAVTISRNSHAVVLGPDPSPSETQAAHELKEYLEASLGGEVPILRDPTALDRPSIVVGCGPAARSMGVDPDPGEIGEQGFVLKTVAPHIVIAGSRQAGTLYGVYRFLERFLGVRWYAPGVTKTPPLTEVMVPFLDHKELPAFRWRHTSYAWPGKDEPFLAHVGDNNGPKDADNPYGVQYSHDGRCHSYFTFISPEEFFDTHPEYFSEIGGVRVREETQLCLTNPDVLEIVTERMLARMADRPHDSQHNFSQMDHYNYCECARCRAINEKYGTKGGTQFWFVNQLAERTSKVYPNKLIGTLAYMYTEEPPRGLTIHPNVAIWLCHMYPSCDSHPVSRCPLNGDYKRRALAWSRLTSHLYIWHYVTDFAHYYNPFPNLRAMAEDMKFYRDIGVEGVYLQGMGNRGGGGEFSLLRPYYGMKLLWNPDQDPEALIEDFLRGYYGEAGGPIGDYIRMLHDKVERENIHMHLYTNPAQGYLTDPVMEQANRLFDRAESAVRHDETLLERVRVARMPLVYANIFPRNGYAIQGGRIKWLSQIAPTSAVLEFVARMERHGFEAIREIAGGPELLLALYLLIRSEPSLYSLQNDLLQVEVVPFLGGRVLRIVDKGTGRCVTAYNVAQNLFFPFAGGLEDRIGEGFEYYGWVEPNLIAKQSRLSITFRTMTVDGWQLERTIALDPERPVLEVESVLTNTGTVPRRTRYRTHLELAPEDLGTTRVSFVSRGGVSVDSDMSGVVAGLREGMHFYDQSAPAGSWTFSCADGLEVVQRFDDDAVDFTWLVAYPETLGELEVEVWAKRVELGPGESMRFRQSLEVRRSQ